MATTAYVGTSHCEDSAQAGREAATHALSGLGGRQASVALVFASADHDQVALLDAIGGLLAGVAIVGCSGEGVIANDESSETPEAVAVMAIASDRLAFETCLFDDYSTAPAAVGRHLAEVVNAGDNVRCVCVMPDGLGGNCTEFLDALHAGLRTPVPIVGGAAADSMLFGRTYQYARGRVISGGVAALLISGEADVEVAVSHGCSPIGLERTRPSRGSRTCRRVS